MPNPRYHFTLNEGNLTIGLETRRENENQFYIHDRGERVNFDFEEFDHVLKIVEQLEKIDDMKEKEMSVNLNEYVKFHRKFISDTSSPYDYQFRITEMEKHRNVRHGIELNGIKQLILVKNTLMKIHDNYVNDRWLDEQIKASAPQFVEYAGEKIEVEKKYSRLQIKNRSINKISDIKGLKEIKFLKILNLRDNEIEEIEGLDNLVYLRALSLGNNNIKEIKGLDKLVNLETLSLTNNPINSLDGLEKPKNLRSLNLSGTLIPKETFKEAGIKDPSHAVEIIKYLQEKKEKNLNREQTKIKATEYIKKASSVFEEMPFSKIIEKTGIQKDDLEELVEDLIFSSKINAKIRKDGIAFIEENPLVDIALETVDVLHEIKDDTKLISQYTSYIEEVFDKTENIEEYLKTHLASEFEKIKDAWQDYKEGKIDKRELIKTGIKQIGKKFVKIFMKKI